MEPSADPDGDATLVTVNLRFPGQIKGDEAPHYYNYFRDYDPTIGRYIQSDPIGVLEDYSDPKLQVALLQGIPLAAEGSSAELNHLYGYANQNSLSYVDFFGLSPNFPGDSGGGSSQQCSDKKDDKKDKKKCKPPKGLKGYAKILFLAWCLIEDRRPPPPPPRKPIPERPAPSEPKK